MYLQKKKMNTHNVFIEQIKPTYLASNKKNLNHKGRDIEFFDLEI